MRGKGYYRQGEQCYLMISDARLYTNQWREVADPWFERKLKPNRIKFKQCNIDLKSTNIKYTPPLLSFFPSFTLFFNPPCTHGGGGADNALLCLSHCGCHLALTAPPASTFFPSFLLGDPLLANCFQLRHSLEVQLQRVDLHNLITMSKMLPTVVT